MWVECRVLQPRVQGHNPRRRRMVGVWGLVALLLGGPAWAGDDVLWRARYALETGDPELAAETTARWLNDAWTGADRRRPEAVMLHLDARTRGLGEGPQLARALEARLAEQPDSPELRVSLAVVLAADPEPDCDRIDPLTHPAPPRPWALGAASLRAQLAPRCGWSEEPLDLADYPKDAPDIVLLRLQRGLSRGVIDQALAYALDDFYRANPAALALPGDPFRSSLSGPGLSIARLALESAAQRAEASNDPMALYGALQVARWKGWDERPLARRLDVLQPGWTDGGGAGDGTATWMPPRVPVDPELLRRIHDASRKAEPVVAVRALKSLEKDVPERGPAAAEWHARMAEAMERQGRDGRALGEWEAAWAADPGDSGRANGFAWAAAGAERRMEPALAAITAAINHPTPFSVREAGADGWVVHRDWSGQELAMMRDTRGWLLFRLGRLYEARDELRHALLLMRSDSGTMHMHLGLVLAELGDPRGALFHLGRGLAIADPEWDELSLIADAMMVLEPLWIAQRWQPGGMEAWIAAQRPAPVERLAPLTFPLDVGAADGAGVREILAATWVGTPFPDLELLTTGGRGTLSGIGGWRVVDFWASWCGPCVEGLPALLALANSRDDLRVVVVSVEDAPPDWDRWLEGSASAVGTWGGPAVLDRLDLPGVPATFLLNPQGEVVDARLGAAPEGWLTTALDEARKP